MGPPRAFEPRGSRPRWTRRMAAASTPFHRGILTAARWRIRLLPSAAGA
jgi:hypothetical protein